MPTSKVYLDDENNVVLEDQATQAVLKEVDAQGRLVEERWLRIAKPGSLAEDLIAIEEKAKQMAASIPPRRIPLWLVAVVVVGLLLLLLG